MEAILSQPDPHFPIVRFVNGREEVILPGTHSNSSADQDSLSFRRLFSPHFFSRIL